MSNSPRVRQTRKAERAAVNAVRSLFEAHDLVFQEVDQSNDYGKDAYVDLTADGELSGHVIALQIKGGSTYVRSSGYAIPCDREHGGFWFNSSVPVIGIIQDPHSQGLYWENLTRYLREVDPSPTSIPVPSSQTLTIESLKAFIDEMVRYLRSYAGSRWLDLASSDPNRQAGAALDCFAIGRFDSRGLILLREVLTRLSGEGFKTGTHLLAHTTPHPDIFWTKDSWISEPIKREVRSALIWQPSELRQLLQSFAVVGEWVGLCSRHEPNRLSHPDGRVLLLSGVGNSATRRRCMRWYCRSTKVSEMPRKARPHAAATTPTSGPGASSATATSAANTPLRPEFTSRMNAALLASAGVGLGPMRGL
jgi:hypothetical protein